MSGETHPLALRFISGKYQGGEFPLPINGELVIGRSSELDMVLVEDMVSRRHAKINVEDGKITISDLGSTNGTFVNGEKVSEAGLGEGDRVLIGTSIIKVVPADASGQAVKPPPIPQPPSGQQTSHVKTMTGSIAEIPLPDLLQLFGASKKSGVLTITSGAHRGEVFLREGTIDFAAVDANYDSADPIKNFVRIMTWKDGTFELDPPSDRSFENAMGMSAEGVLMEAMRQLDELERLGPDMPELTASLSVPTPLEPPLRDLSPEELDVFQLSFGAVSVQGLLDRSRASDAETGQHLVKLIKLGYLKAT